MKIRLVTLVLSSAIAAASPALAAEEPSARELLESVRAAVPEASLHSQVKLSSNRGWERELEIYAMNVDDEVATFIEVIGPQDVKDTRFLFFERSNAPDEQHVYIPLVKRAIQIADNTRKQAFLGSDFYVSDLVAPEMGRYEYRYVGEEEVLGRSCKKVEAVPKEIEGEIYSKVVSAIDPKDKLVLKTYSYDVQGELFKVWTVKKLEKVEEIWTFLEQEMENVQDKTTSTIEVVEIDYNVELPGDVFSRARLLR